MVILDTCAILEVLKPSPSFTAKTSRLIDGIELIWEENKDPADRLITAFAIKNELPIVTTDKKSQNFTAK